MYSRLMISTLTILSLRRNSSSSMGNTPRKKPSSVLILTESRKLFGWKRQNKPTHLLTVLHGWIHSSKSGTIGIPFKKFETAPAKIRHAFTAIPAGRGLFTPCNRIFQLKPPLVYLQLNLVLRAAIMGCRTLLRESSDSPTRCCKLVSGWPDYIGVCDASSHRSIYTLVE